MIRCPLFIRAQCDSKLYSLWNLQNWSLCDCVWTWLIKGVVRDAVFLLSAKQRDRLPDPLCPWRLESLVKKSSYKTNEISSCCLKTPHADSQQEALLMTELGVLGTEEPGSGNRNLGSLIIAAWVYYLVNKSESFWSWTLDCLTFLGWLKLLFKGHQFLINPPTIPFPSLLTTLVFLFLVPHSFKSRFQWPHPHFYFAILQQTMFRIVPKQPLVLVS